MTFYPPFDFYCSIYKDEIFLVRLAYQVNRFFPESKLIVIADGPFHKFSVAAAKNFNQNLILIEGERLKHKPTGGCEFTQRNLEVVLTKSNASTIIKLDTDTYINHTFRFIDAPWFGHVYHTSLPFMGETFDFIAGGAMGFSRQAITAIVESKELLNKKFDNRGGFYDRYKNYKKFADPMGESDLIRREDWVLGMVCKKLSIKATPWSEVYCVQDEEVFDNSYSIVHPVRTRW
jgi:hypothetical protein